MDIKPGPLLATIDSPTSLKRLSPKELTQVCNELREYIIDMVSKYGGHLAANLGVVELTVALHYVFDAPHDKIVWDVGHQAYGHKILTGRRDSFITNRKYHGLSGFPKMSESDFDAFGVGHSSTSISAALGMAIAAGQKGETGRQHVAVIGDGALTAGIAFEAMNHAGASNTDLLIILNDNAMSIDPNVGALKEYLTGITLQNKDGSLAGVNQHLPKRPPGEELLEEGPAAVPGSLVHNSSHFFESLNLRYFGPVDGHEIQHLIEVLEELKNTSGPKLLHIKTIKGKGYLQAEKDQTVWHAPGLFDKVSGKIRKKQYDGPQPPRYQDVFGITLLELARKNPKIMGITPAMPTGSGMKKMMDEMPGRALDVGICEQHAVTLSAGMATDGMKVFCNIYSSFMQRAYDQVIHDVAIQDLPVIFCLDRAGLVGEDGATHHGAYDMAFLRCIPNIIVSAPMNEQELRNLMYTAQLDATQHPFSIRYPRGQGVMVEWQTGFEEIQIGTGRELRTGKELAILTIGHVGNFAAQAIVDVVQEGMNPGHYDMRFVKPLDEVMLHRVCRQYSKIITVEDGTIKGGFGSAVLEFVNTHQYGTAIKILGIPDRLIEHGSQAELYAEAGIDAQSIANEILEMMPPIKS